MKKVPRIELDTPLVPRAVMEGVREEAGLWLDQPLPRRWVRELTAFANTVYAHNPRFRRKICGQGTSGRDYLWMFARHWLYALLGERRPHLAARLPSDYRVGRPLPSKPNTPPHWLDPRSGVDWKKFNQRKRKAEAGAGLGGVPRVTSTAIQPAIASAAFPATGFALKAGRKKARTLPAPVRPRPRSAPDYAFAAAAHFHS